MLRNKLLALILLVPFAVYTAFTMSIADQSLLSFGHQLISSPDTAQVVIDLYIMAVLAIVWMYRDSRKLRAKWFWIPFAALTLVFVSAGPLLYLVLRPENAFPET